MPSSVHEEDIIHTIPVPGNFGGTCHTSRGLFISPRFPVQGHEGSTHFGRQYFNCSNGAAIEGALAKSSRSIKLEAIDGGKRQVVEDLIERFPVYSAETFDGFWQDEVMVERMEKFIASVREKVDAPKDFSDKKYLSDLMSFLQGPFTTRTTARHDGTVPRLHLLVADDVRLLPRATDGPGQDKGIRRNRSRGITITCSTNCWRWRSARLAPCPRMPAHANKRPASRPHHTEFYVAFLNTIINILVNKSSGTTVGLTLRQSLRITL